MAKFIQLRALTYHDVQKSLNKLAAMIPSSTGATAGLSPCLYVDPAGNDGTAQRGSLTLRYQTIQAAVNAAQDGDIVVVAPGTYAESVTIPPSRALGIVGSGECTRILPPVGDAIYFAPNADTGLLVENLCCDGWNGGGDIRILPQTNDLGRTRRLIIRNVLLDNNASIRVKRAYGGLVEGIRAQQGYNGVFLEETEEMTVRDCRCTRLVIGWAPNALSPCVVAGRTTWVHSCDLFDGSSTGIARPQLMDTRVFVRWEAYPAQEGALGPTGAFEALGCKFGDLWIMPIITDGVVIEPTGVVIASRIHFLLCGNQGAGPSIPTIKVHECAFIDDTGGPGNVQGGQGMLIDLRRSRIGSSYILTGVGTTFYVSEYDLGPVLNPVVVNGPTVIGPFPIVFADPSKVKVRIISKTVDAVFTVVAVGPNTLTLDARVAGAVAPAAADVVLTQTDN